MMVALIWEIMTPPFVFLLVQTAVLLLYYTWEKGYAVCGNCITPQDVCDVGTEDEESMFDDFFFFFFFGGGRGGRKEATKIKGGGWIISS